MCEKLEIIGLGAFSMCLDAESFVKIHSLDPIKSLNLHEISPHFLEYRKIGENPVFNGVDIFYAPKIQTLKSLRKQYGIEPQNILSPRDREWFLELGGLSLLSGDDLLRGLASCSDPRTADIITAYNHIVNTLGIDPKGLKFECIDKNVGVFPDGSICLFDIFADHNAIYGGKAGCFDKMEVGGFYEISVKRFS